MNIDTPLLPGQFEQAIAAASRFETKRKRAPRRDGDTKARKAMRRDLVPSGDTMGLERVLGESDLLPITFLLRGLQRSKSVCRINVMPPGGARPSLGTGFMVSPCLLLTNNHVLPDVAHVTVSFAEFGFEQDVHFRPMPSQCFPLDGERFFYTNLDMDFTLVAVKPESFSGVPLVSYEFIRLIEESGKALIGEKVSLIQHPAGRHKMLTVRNSIVLDPAHGHFVHYDADTEPGSSGSPVFNDQWEVVALHHSGVPKKNARGQVLLRNGRVRSPGTRDSEIDWIANEGVRISAIFTDLCDTARAWTRPQLECLVSLANRPGSKSAQHFAALLAGDRLTAPAISFQEGTPTYSGVLESAPSLTLSQLLDRASDPDIDEAELAPYFVPATPSGRSLDPVFVLNERLVQVDPDRPEESALALNLANWVCKKNRHQKYARKMAQARLPGAAQPVRILAEGDSWFQYPFVLNDIIDHLMDRDDLAVLCFSEAGDILSRMVARGEFYPALQRETPSYFLVSGGGNDMVDGPGLTALLPPFSPHLDPGDYLADNWQAFLDRISGYYRQLFERVLHQNANVRIICHGYDYAVPNNGPWLGKPLSSIGITDPQLQRDILRLLVDDVNEVVQVAAAAHNQRVRYVDCRNSVPNGGWHDEFHPISSAYKIAADRIYDAIKHW